MKENKKIDLLIKNMNAGKARQKIVSMPSRYRNYVPKNGEGNWRIAHMSEKQGKLQFMLVDKKFDKPQANAMPECPVFHATVEQQGEDVRFTCQQKWQTNTMVLGILYAVLTLAILGGGIYFLAVSNWVSGIACMVAFAVAAAMMVVYLVRLAKHNALTCQVLKEILSKNFVTDTPEE